MKLLTFTIHVHVLNHNSEVTEDRIRFSLEEKSSDDEDFHAFVVMLTHNTCALYTLCSVS